MTTRSYEGRTAVVTGGAGGIGLALARRFGRAGARVALLDRDEGALGAAAAALGTDGIEARAFVCDVTDAARCEAVMAQVRVALGPVYLLMNHAGAVHRSDFADTRVEVLRTVMEVNLFGAVHCTKAALDDLRREHGQVIVTSSIAGLAPLAGRTGYCAAKHALHGLFGTLRAELVADGVGVLLACPTFTESGFEAAALGGDGRPARHARDRAGRLYQPDEVAELVFEAARRDRAQLVISGVGKLSAILARLAPEIYQRLMLRSLRT